MRLISAALLIGTVSAGCVNILVGIGGTDTCAVMTAGGEASCTAAASLGCSWNGVACISSPFNCAALGRADCSSAANAQKCLWNEPGVCDAADSLACVGSNSAYMQCILDGSGVGSLTAIYANLSVAVDLSARINANIDRILCSCMTLMFTCIYDGDCGRDAAWMAGWNQACSSAFASITAQRPGLTSCSTSWCNVGRTTAVSTFTVRFTFAASNLPSSWPQSRKDAFLAALRAELAGVESDWMTFDASTGLATVTIPSGTSISVDQMNTIKASFESWRNPQSSQAAPMFDAMGVQGSEVTAEPAPIATSSGFRAGMSLVAAAFAVVFAFFM